MAWKLRSLRFYNHILSRASEKLCVFNCILCPGGADTVHLYTVSYGLDARILTFC